MKWCAGNKMDYVNIDHDYANIASLEIGVRYININKTHTHHRYSEKVNKHISVLYGTLPSVFD